MFDYVSGYSVLDQGTIPVQFAKNYFLIRIWSGRSSRSRIALRHADVVIGGRFTNRPSSLVSQYVQRYYYPFIRRMIVVRIIETARIATSARGFNASSAAEVLDEGAGAGTAGGVYVG